MKKLSVLLAAFILVSALLFVGCGIIERNGVTPNGGTSETNDGKNGTQEKAQAKAVQEFQQLIDEGAYKDAITQYNEKIVGNSKLEQEAANVITNYLIEVKDKLLSGEMSQSYADITVKTVGNVYNGITCSVSDYRQLTQDIEVAKASKIAYKTGIALFNAKSYVDAIAEFKKVIEDDSDYIDAKAKITEATDLYKAEVTAKADSLIAADNYPEAITRLKDAVAKFPDDTDLSVKLSTSEKTYISSTVAKAEAAFVDYTKYQDALGIINAALQHYPEDTTLLEKKEYYGKFEPVGLYDHISIRGDAYELGADTSTYNEKFTECFTSNTSGRGIDISYDIKKEYNKFNATIYGRSSENKSYIYTLVIYGDGVILYKNENIKDNGKSFDISIDITGVSELRIESLCTGNYSISAYGYGMTNMFLQRTVK